MRWSFKRLGNEVIAVTSNFAPDFINLLNQYGLELYDVTPIIEHENGKYVFRQDEIKKWLSQNDDVESFVILDDESTFLMDFVGENLIVLNCLPVGEMVRDMRDSTGLCKEHVEMAIEVLNHKQYSKRLNRSINH